MWSIRSDFDSGDLGFDPLRLRPESPDEFREMQVCARAYIDASRLGDQERVGSEGLEAQAGGVHGAQAAGVYDQVRIKAADARGCYMCVRADPPPCNVFTDKRAQQRPSSDACYRGDGRAGASDRC